MGFGISDLYSILPAGTRYRELWLPELINSNATLPSSIAGGHPLTLTGARKGTTCDGVHFAYRHINSSIDCGVIHNAAAKLWVSFRFKLDQPFSSADTSDEWLWSKYISGNDFIAVRLYAATGHLLFYKSVGGIPAFSIYSAQASWEAGVWYHVLASISDANGARLRINNGAAVIDADVSAVPNGGNFVIGNREVGEARSLGGVIADFFCGTDDLLQAAPDEEYDLYAGIPPADAVNEWLLDEGRGVTAYDRGSGVNNGTLDTSCTWQFGQVQQPVISFDAINDRAQSSAGINISGDLTVVWVGKMKSTYGAGLTGNQVIYEIRISGTEYMYLASWSLPPPTFLWQVESSGIWARAEYIPTLSIDDYFIFIGTEISGGILNFFHNGVLVATASGQGIVSGAAATATLGDRAAGGTIDISKPLFVSLIDGAFTQKQALAYSKLLNELLGLGLTI